MGMLFFGCTIIGAIDGEGGVGGPCSGAVFDRLGQRDAYPYCAGFGFNSLQGEGGTGGVGGSLKLFLAISAF